MTVGRIGILTLLVGVLQSSSLASSASKTFKATPEQVFAAAEQALRENSRLSSVDAIRPQLKIEFKGPRLSALEHYSALSGEASISQATAGKCLLTISVADVRVSSAGSYSHSLDPANRSGLREELRQLSPPPSATHPWAVRLFSAKMGE